MIRSGLRRGDARGACPSAPSPALRSAQGPASVALWAIDVREADAPVGDTPVHWRLLTAHDLADPAKARQVIDWYRRRWTIEQLFRTTDIAHRRLQHHAQAA